MFRRSSVPSDNNGKDKGSAKVFHRATNDASGVRLWYRDPNGTDVAIRLPIDANANNRPGQEIDPDHIVSRLQAAAESAKEVHANGE